MFLIYFESLFRSHVICYIRVLSSDLLPFFVAKRKFSMCLCSCRQKTAKSCENNFSFSCLAQRSLLSRIQTYQPAKSFRLQCSCISPKHAGTERERQSSQREREHLLSPSCSFSLYMLATGVSSPPMLL